MTWQQALKQSRFWPFGALSSGNKPDTGKLLINPISDIKWLSIDLELTGLELAQDDIVSIGWIAGQSFSMSLDSCHHAHIQTDSSLKQSPIIHGITHVDLQEASPLAPELENLTKFAATHIWVFHCHQLDWGILSRRFTELFGDCPKPIILDTLTLERYITGKSGAINAQVDLTNARARHNLRSAPAHAALEDATATLELLFAQLSNLGIKSTDKLKSLKHTGAIRRL